MASANLKITHVVGITFLLDNTMITPPFTLSSDFPQQCGPGKGLDSRRESRRKIGIDFGESTHGQGRFHSGHK